MRPTQERATGSVWLLHAQEVMNSGYSVKIRSKSVNAERMPSQFTRSTFQPLSRNPSKTVRRLTFFPHKLINSGEDKGRACRAQHYHKFSKIFFYSMPVINEKCLFYEGHFQEIN